MSCTAVRSGPAIAPYSTPEYPPVEPMFCNANMVAFYPLDEAAGDALDAHTGGYDFTAYNAPGSDTGLVYPLAREYIYASTQYHSSDGYETHFRANGYDFTWAGWVKVLSSGAFSGKVLTKYNDAGIYDPEYDIFYVKVFDYCGFWVNDVDWNTIKARLPDSSYSEDDWFFLAASCDQTAQKIYISINAGVPVDADLQGFDLPADVGNVHFAHQQGSIIYADIMMQCWGFWRSDPGGGGCLTSEQLTALYNGGAGLTYAEMCAL